MSEKSYLYHQVPSALEGDILHPLNDLKEIYPEAHAREVGKYAGREHLLERIIPGTDWKWNDAIHLAAVHPAELARALREAGGSPPVFESFEIDPKEHGMTPENTVFYFHPIGGGEYTEPFDAAKISGYANIPEETKEYYREALARGEKPFLFHGIPHILHKGSLGTNKMRRVQG